jgi:inner membrane protein
MKYYTHIAGSLFFYLIVALLFQIDHLFIGLFFAAWISIFPDIIDKIVGKHRGLGHSIFWFIPILITGFYSDVLLIALFIGFASHLVLDIFTVHGCPLLYPLKKSNFVALNKKNRIKTSTNQDKAVFVFFLVFLIPLFLFTTSLGPMIKLGESQYVMAAFMGDNQTNETIQSGKNYLSISLNLNNAGNKNITMERVNDTVTTIIVKDLPTGG